MTKTKKGAPQDSSGRDPRDGAGAAEERPDLTFLSRLGEVVRRVEVLPHPEVRSLYRLRLNGVEYPEIFESCEAAERTGEALREISEIPW